MAASFKQRMITMLIIDDFYVLPENGILLWQKEKHKLGGANKQYAHGNQASYNFV